MLTWTGDVPAGEAVVITYSVKVNAAGEMGDRTLDNVVTGGENCPDDDVCATTSLLPDYEAEKSVVGSHTQVSERVSSALAARTTNDAACWYSVPLATVLVPGLVPSAAVR